MNPAYFLSLKIIRIRRDENGCNINSKKSHSRAWFRPSDLTELEKIPIPTTIRKEDFMEMMQAVKVGHLANILEYMEKNPLELFQAINWMEHTQYLYFCITPMLRMWRDEVATKLEDNQFILAAVEEYHAIMSDMKDIAMKYQGTPALY